MTATNNTNPQPEYLNQFCPILSHAVLKPEPPKAEPSKLLAIGGEVAAAAPVDTGREYIGCQGPSCGFFVKSEGKCGVPLISMGLAMMIRLQAQALPSEPPTPH